ncbi:AraC family transcriptional regulator [Bacterioplanes sanyensis]|uniref:AraC family transcriptional regulator n=1 Tax=Bacterioplanes sanyensis TaxID=1249553 RepID=UPI001675221F|nr:AraC family transcriptional regulator [Bacterioplanes sanyensis]GGY54673.1 AraC family transcriptional regulator [Bacterioplanes sanyensis]
MWSIGACRVQPLAHEPHRHQHPHHQVVLGLHGQVWFELPPAQQRHFGPEHGCLLPSDCEHSFHGDGDNAVVIIDVSVKDESPLLIDADLFQQLFAEPRFVDLDDNLRNLIASLAQELESRPHDLPLQQHISGLLLHSLFHRIAPYRHPSHTRGGRIDMAMLDQLIAERLTDKIGVDELASACHMSSSQFHLRFRQLTGMTPYQYVLQQRVQQAAWLLQNSSMSISAIAAETGFANQSALNHAIKARFGLSPGQLRRK